MTGLKRAERDGMARLLVRIRAVRLGATPRPAVTKRVTPVTPDLTPPVTNVTTNVTPRPRLNLAACELEHYSRG